MEVLSPLLQNSLNPVFKKACLTQNVTTNSCYVSICAWLPSSRESKQSMGKDNAIFIFINLVKPIMHPETAFNCFALYMLHETRNQNIPHLSKNKILSEVLRKQN